LKHPKHPQPSKQQLAVGKTISDDPQHNENEREWPTRARLAVSGKKLQLKVQNTHIRVILSETFELAEASILLDNMFPDGDSRDTAIKEALSLTMKELGAKYAIIHKCLKSNASFVNALIVPVRPEFFFENVSTVDSLITHTPSGVWSEYGVGGLMG
jgi:hypothetical protein